MIAGTDATEDFEAIHSKKAWKLLESWRIGRLGAGDAAPAVVAPKASKLVALGKAKIKLQLVRRDRLSEDSFLLRFALPSPEHVLGLPVGKHVLVYGKDASGKTVARAYTPATADEVKGYVEFVIKAYRPLPPRFPHGGHLSQYLCDRISVGDDVEFRGPLGEIEYLGQGGFEIAEGKTKRLVTCSKAGLIAGGTGLTPMLQLITAAAAERARGDATVAYSLLLGNRTEEDILCREQLEDAMRAGAVDLYYTLDKPPEGWSYFSGFVDAPMLETTMPAPGPDTVCFLCGPPPMVNSALAKLEALGHAPENLFCF